MSRDSIVLVTQNEHKIRELTPLFEEYDVPFETNDLPKYEVRSPSVGNVALEAAKYAYSKLKKAVVVDDTSLTIEALNGFPGPTARYVLESIGIEGVLKLMDGVEDRDAYFDTGVGFANGWVFRYFIGTVYGDIATSPLGKNGFGYDPIFIPEGETRTYAQLSIDEKIKMSHRTEAFRKFLEWYIDKY
ncbi:MAG: RdgB/HAM1 family non-canonical purine NTP pyrophosphatase [Candidatus Thorarchaeota archaeon]